eukprot:TRINITY_DN2585_c0_g3_i1.p1 TRINITY_DN2585_c0_g3~~TRINITY_DN2585_c0_g3_i1.p1  ORF type:complete len:171 (+),score=35.59 TRINITY_DN2585_c0_g3_i1:49-513(+)
MNWKNSTISEVAKEKIWKEHVRNESQYMKSKESFSVNPYRLDKTKPICESICARPKRFLAKELYMGGNVIERQVQETTLTPEEMTRREKTAAQIHECLLSVHKTPVEKYPFPQTESQEIGWISQPLVKPQPQFQHSLRSCDITRFAGDTTISGR